MSRRPTPQLRRVPNSPLVTARRGRPRRRRGRGPRAAALLLLGAVVLAVGTWALLLDHDTDPPPPPAGAMAEDIVLVHPTYLGGPRRDSAGPGPAPDKLDVLWRVKIGSGQTRLPTGSMATWSGTGWTGQPTLIVHDGRPFVVVGGYDHGLRRIDADTGEVLWRAQLDDVIKGTNSIFYDASRAAGDRLVVVSGSRRGVDRELGDPAIAPLRAFSFASGAELWRMPVPRTANYSQDVDASPLYVDGRLIVAVEPGYVLALDPVRTEPGPEGHSAPVVLARSPELWSANDVASRPWMGGANLALEGSPAVLGERIYIASSSGHVYGLNRRTLEIEWDFAPGGDFDSTVTVTRDGKLLVGMERQYASRGGTFLLDPDKPPAEAVEWFFPTEDRGVGEWQGGVVGSVALHEHEPLAAFCSVDGFVYVVRTDVLDGDAVGWDGATRVPTPALVFRARIGGSISTPAFSGNRMVVAGFDNTVRLYSLDTAGGYAVREIDTFTGGGPFESTPLVYNGRVYIGCRDGFFYCLGE